MPWVPLLKYDLLSGAAKNTLWTERFVVDSRCSVAFVLSRCVTGHVFILFITSPSHHVLKREEDALMLIFISQNLRNIVSDSYHLRRKWFLKKFRVVSSNMKNVIHFEFLGLFRSIIFHSLSLNKLSLCLLLVKSESSSNCLTSSVNFSPMMEWHSWFLCLLVSGRKLLWCRSVVHTIGSVLVRHGTVTSCQVRIFFERIRDVTAPWSDDDVTVTDIK